MWNHSGWRSMLPLLWCWTLLSQPVSCWQLPVRHQTCNHYSDNMSRGPSANGQNLQKTPPLSTVWCRQQPQGQLVLYISIHFTATLHLWGLSIITGPFVPLPDMQAVWMRSKQWAKTSNLWLLLTPRSTVEIKIYELSSRGNIIHGLQKIWP